MEFVEINADRKPRLTGGRRGSPILLPGGTNVTNNLVPPAMLPPSAGSLADVFNNLGKTMSSPSELMNVGKTLKGKGRKKGGATLGQILQHPSDHQNAFDLILKGAKGGKRGRPKKGGAMVQNADGSFTGVGSDDMSWARMPKKGGAYIGTDGKVHVPSKIGKLGVPLDGIVRIPRGEIPEARGGLVHHKKGYIPRHGHGANTNIGTNYQLSQFGGSMAQPIGNTSSILSPALSTGSVGAGRKSLPKGKNLKKLLKFMSDAKKHLYPHMKGGDLMGDAWDSIKHIGHELYKEYGPQIFDKGKDLLLGELKKHAHNYITGAGLSGGDFWGDVWDGIKAVASGLWDALQLILNDDVVKEVERDVLHMGVKMAGDYAKQQMASGMSGSSGAGLPSHLSFLNPTGAGMPGANGHGIRKIGGKKPSARGAIVSKVMKEKGLSLPLASKYVKEHGLY